MGVGIATLAEPKVLAENDNGKFGHIDARGQGPVENWLHAHLNFFVFSVLIAAFLIRVYTAAITYLNPDEILHYIIFHRPSALSAYYVSLTNAHPPLIYFLLYYWSFLGRSELMLRFPSVLAGTAFCWVAYKWIESLFGKAAGIFALILVSFLPVMIALSAEVRSYALLLVCETTALYLIEVALNKKSTGKIWCFAVFLYLAILSHYSAVFFVAAVGAYSAGRLFESKFPKDFVWSWAISQCGALAIYGFLYVTHLSKLKLYITAWQVSFDQVYSHTSHQHFFTYAWERTVDIFLFLFQNQHLALGMLLLWIISMGALFVKEWKFPYLHRLTRFTGFLLLLPILGVFTAGVLGYYPYIGSRHTIFLAPFLISALSSIMGMIFVRKIWAAILIAAFLVGVTYTGGKLSEPYLTRENQSISLMNDSLSYIRRTIPAGEPIVTDYQSAIMYEFYICGRETIVPVGMFNFPFSKYNCNGNRLASFQTWGMKAPFFLSNFSNMARAQHLASGQRVWVVQSGWGGTLGKELISNFPQFRCLSVKSFGDDISIFPILVDSDLSPAATVTGCSSGTSTIK